MSVSIGGETRFVSRVRHRLEMQTLAGYGPNRMVTAATTGQASFGRDTASARRFARDLKLA